MNSASKKAQDSTEVKELSRLGLPTSFLWNSVILYGSFDSIVSMHRVSRMGFQMRKSRLLADNIAMRMHTCEYHLKFAWYNTLSLCEQSDSFVDVSTSIWFHFMYQFILQKHSLKTICLDHYHLGSSSLTPFQHQEFIRYESDSSECPIMKINSFASTINNLRSWYKYDDWKDLFCQHKLILAGGAAVHAVCGEFEPFWYHDLDLFFVNSDKLDEEDLSFHMESIIGQFSRLSRTPAVRGTRKRGGTYVVYNVDSIYINLTDNESEVWNQPFDEMPAYLEENEKFYLKIQFISHVDNIDPASIVSCFDLNLNQVYFDGVGIHGTQAFVHGIENKYILSFKQNDLEWSWLDRVSKYSRRYCLDMLVHKSFDVKILSKFCEYVHGDSKVNVLHVMQNESYDGWTSDIRDFFRKSSLSGKCTITHGLQELLHRPLHLFCNRDAFQVVQAHKQYIMAKLTKNKN